MPSVLTPAMGAFFFLTEPHVDLSQGQIKDITKLSTCFRIVPRVKMA
jgi:hypothetical protein